LVRICPEEGGSANAVCFSVPCFKEVLLSKSRWSSV